MMSHNCCRLGRGTVGAAATLALLGSLAGCQEEAPVAFEPNLVKAHQIEMTEGIEMELALEDTRWVLHNMFGTPDEPRIPAPIREDEDLASLLSLERLQAASGPPDAEGRGLYRQHCSTCHGITGNGRGRTAALINPYPRDYRMGIFKFKTTERGGKPTREDIAHSIREGIAGTAMVKIPSLTEEDIQALTDYVIYLSIRGELERLMLEDVSLYGLYIPEEPEEEEEAAAGESTAEEEETAPEMPRLINPALANSAEGSEERATYDEQMGYIVEHLNDEIAMAWLEAADEVVEVTVPEDLPLPQSYQEFQAMMEGDQAEVLQASVDRGKKLFVGKIALCSKCHGEQGTGDGQTNDYDEWTKDWTVRAGLDPQDYDSLIPLIARGALPPRNIHPRNFAEGIFRGGGRPQDLYRRIHEGIAGTPMPAATFVEGEFEERDVWHLINFIRSLDEGKQATVPGPTEMAAADE